MSFGIYSQPILFALMAFLFSGMFPLNSDAQSQAVLSLVDDANKAVEEGKYEDAEKALVEAINTAPGDASNVFVLSNLGMVRLYMGKDSAAIATLDRAVAIAPSSVTLRSNRARALFAVGRDDDAIADMERIMELDSTLITPYYYRGSLRLKRGDLQGAESDFETMHRIDPVAPENDIAMASLLDAKGHYEEAVPFYNHAILLDPDPVYLAGRARCNIMLGRYTRASEDIQQALEMTPDDGELYLLRAMLNKAQYRPEDAAQDARKALELGVARGRLRQFLE